MADVTIVNRKHHSGLEADKAGITGAFGETYAATDSGKLYYWTGSAWKQGLVEKMIDHTWEGDGLDDREIDLGDDYDLIFIFYEEATSGMSTWGIAYAFKTVYGIVGETSETMSGANDNFQGKMDGADINKIKLGGNAGSTVGTNRSSKSYRLIGFKFLDME